MKQTVRPHCSPFCVVLCLFVATPASALAAPPTLTHLYPGGAQRGTTVDLTAGGAFEQWPVKVAVSGAGVTVSPAKDKGKLSVAVAKDAVPGVYWLRAHNDEGASGLRPFVVGTLPDVAEKEPNDDARKPQVIVGNVVVNGRLEKAGDVDCFGVALKKGQALVASLDAHSGLRSPADPILQVVSADGFVLDENHDFRGLDPQLAFTAPTDGTYVVRVFGFPSAPDSSIRFFGSEACVYRLTLTTGAFADHAAPLAVAKPEDAATVALDGWNVPKALRLEAAADARHATLFAPELANAVRVRVEKHPTFASVPADPKPPFSLTGRIAAGGAEVLVPFACKKGQPLTVQVESRAFGLAVNPVVRVLDQEKKQVARAEPAKLNGDTSLTFTPTADGPHTVAVSDLYSGGGARFVFLLRVAPPEPDYELTVAADRFTLEPGKPLSVPVKVARKGGFAKPVEVVAEGLPAGVKAEVTQPAKPDPNTVTLSLTTDVPVVAPFRLVGKVKDDPALTRTAAAPLADLDHATPDLWVTAGAAPPPKKK
ncbi:Putative pre-peptidase OS=Singulisphaera acidiphila (strain ATCC BAA-1392 / DSM 18658 / VKM B-2454 / MOB10) GN=Sinac_2823 PE=4 SV=1: PPC [Gemmataceae bacterium]|nr:Putative pre-peptidase OS=Singulisphaera acidiphila (strain ATCC BAA-1392 / DSM 18658 / VKM B-2454 / MOB10) GN=Sinac_2823 PE=4 SV=1: PPC [Gemmataceae bacterium]VTT97173.1 Putative pre-peptidase OS=Singulisphaera acidiphila (strain ATCC BAA-1392 / DSM 18658 / VKM B-2454 / MOB10) GN=Sinac_2823 PE=4 SV=1: PPC [Gemmataceae bacterium]